ncbi:MAG: hypothetical protein HFG00_06160 [Oscillibacter sp.]|nr:hypothetical protein [Oscillibacter sp.]
MENTAQTCEQQKTLLAAYAAEAGKDKAAPAWLEPQTWELYADRMLRASLYRSFSDEELLSILRHTAEELGRLPSKKEVFCVYREFLIWRFTNWPRALVAAGLKPPKKERRARNLLRMEQKAEAEHLARRTGKRKTT